MPAPVLSVIIIHDGRLGARMLQYQSAVSAYSTAVVSTYKTVFHHAKNL